MRILGTLFDEPGTCRNYELRLPPMLITRKKTPSIEIRENKTPAAGTRLRLYGMLASRRTTV